MIRAWPEHEPVCPQSASQPRSLFALAASILYWKIQRFALRLPFHISRNAAPASKNDTWTSPNTVLYKVLLQYYSVLQSTLQYNTTPVLLLCTTPVPLSWLILVTYETSPNTAPATQMTLMIDPHDTWNVIYNARSNRGVSPTSPNTAPATQKDSHDWSAWHMKRYLQCAEQQVSSSNITEYCTCQEKWLSNISQKFLQNSWNVIYNAGPIREWSEHDPTMIREWNRHSATRLATEATFRARHEQFVLN